MPQGLSVGLPRMHKEPGERRDFHPSLVAFMRRVGARAVMVERGYGEPMGVATGAYLEAASEVAVGSMEDCFRQDVVVVLRCPDEAQLRLMKRGAVLVSMLHYPTRPQRVALLKELGIRAVSLDGIVDDVGRRLVENLASVGWNGLREAFRALAVLRKDFASPERGPVKVVVLGNGEVGGHAARAAGQYGDRALRAQLAEAGCRGVEVVLLDHDLTRDHTYLEAVLRNTDVLVDATLRPDAGKVVVPNRMFAVMPEHAVLVDLSVDPYRLDGPSPSVKALEGVPEGNLDKYLFAPTDPAWNALDARVNTTHRRTVLSCYSWPGLDPAGCMVVYSNQLEPIMRVILQIGLDNAAAVGGTYHERAVHRADVRHWGTQR